MSRVNGLVVPALTASSHTCLLEGSGPEQFAAGASGSLVGASTTRTAPLVAPPFLRWHLLGAHFPSISECTVVHPLLQSPLGPNYTVNAEVASKNRSPTPVRVMAKDVGANWHQFKRGWEQGIGLCWLVLVFLQKVVCM